MSQKSSDKMDAEKKSLKMLRRRLEDAAKPKLGVEG